jgi:hypothetical protein
MTRMNSSSFAIRASGDGYEVLNPEREVVAWTLDRKWALRILLALEVFATDVDRIASEDQSDE